MEKGLLKSMGTVLTLFLVVRNCFECISFIIKLNSLKYLPFRLCWDSCMPYRALELMCLSVGICRKQIIEESFPCAYQSRRGQGSHNIHTKEYS